MDSIRIIENACNAIALNGCGALIVIEGSQSLDDVVASGVAIGKPLNETLLIDIFRNTSPLHDGAVVVRQGVVIAASCALPIVPRAGGHRFGLRHRAALEMSRVSDAVIYVVSQERSTVAIVKNRELTYINR